MCQTRAYKHACGHTTVRRLSSCRFTYASPNSQMPLCSADSAPSFTVTVNKRCQSCLYNNFLQYWQRRIDCAREKYQMARQISIEMQRDNDWECSEVSSGEVCSEYDINSDQSFFGSSNDIENALLEKQRSEKELERLMAEFEREQWDHWRGYMQPPRVQQQQAPTRMKLRRKTSSPRHPGRSALNRSISADDLPPVDLPGLDEESSDSASNDDQNSLNGNDLETPFAFDPVPVNNGWNWGWEEHDIPAYHSTARTRKPTISMEPTMVRLDAIDESDDMLPCW